MTPRFIIAVYPRITWVEEPPNWSYALDGIIVITVDRTDDLRVRVRGERPRAFLKLRGAMKYARRRMDLIQTRISQAPYTTRPICYLCGEDAVQDGWCRQHAPEETSVGPQHP